MSPIHWLRFLKTVKTNIDGHYILKAKENFMVFTSKPVNGISCTKISERNIRGEEKPQYIADIVHKFDPRLHNLTQPNECKVYYNENKKELESYEEKLNSISQSTSIE